MSDSDAQMFHRVASLPLKGWDENWHRIYVDEDIKSRALNYFLLLNTLRQADVSRMALALHGLVILYGPPGTGKTTLARGLANAVAKELHELRSIKTIYLEIDAHKLSSMWLGEGPKLVERAFSRVEEFSTTGSPVICLLDEVESLLTNRALTLNEANPVDVFRAVNAVFQQIDHLAELRNVSILATSNLPKAIDRAFFDRADMMFFVDFPNVKMRHLILKDILDELGERIGTKVAVPDSPPPQNDHPWNVLLRETDGLSGRQMRKLVAEALTYDHDVARRPETLTIDHIVQAARYNRERQERDRERGGVYEYSYGPSKKGYEG
jgi:SpoVK/Ycf46/Vps4 family AAA+-type ATPase